MIMADKILNLRKQNGWSQEELAEKLGVSRQAVSKWESAQSTPDLDRVLQMSRLFGVSTDYLIKDEVNLEEHTPALDDTPALSTVSMEQADEFLRLTGQNARPMALATALCILSPICLLLLTALSQQPSMGIPDNLAAGGGISILLILVAIAVMLFLQCGNRVQKYEFLEHEVIDTAYGVDGMVREREESFHPTYARMNTIGVVLCILSVLPIMFAMMSGKSDLGMMIGVCLLLTMIALAVACFVFVGTIHEGYQKLLQIEDYAPERKKNARLMGIISTVYWCVVTAIYLGWSFSANDWSQSWMIWPVAGVLFGAVSACISLFHKKEQ